MYLQAEEAPSSTSGAAARATNQVTASAAAGEKDKGKQAGDNEPQGEEEGPTTLAGWLWLVVKSMGPHLLRSLFSMCLMLAVMWMMGMMPDQLQKRMENEQAAMQAAADAAKASGADGMGPAGVGAAGVGGVGLEGLLDDGQEL